MPSFANWHKELIATALLASGGTLFYYLLKRRSNSENVWKELDIPNSVYNVVKDLTRKSYETSRVILVESSAQWENVYKLLEEDLKLIKVIGMDCEWITRGKRKPVSMLQLSTLNYTVLVRLHLLELLESIPQTLINLLEDRSILKVGVGALDDRQKLLVDYSIEMAGCVDLRHMAGRHKKSWSGGGLKKFAEEIAGMSLDKSDLLRRGDWEAEPLSQAMQEYAARDSQAGLAIFLCLVALKLQSKPEYESESALLEAVQRRSVPMCHGIVDLHYKMNPSKKGAADVNKVQKSSSPGKSISTNALRSRTMYSNCVMQAPDGQVLCVCDVKKARWYCEKELADQVSDENAEEMVIRLRFEPQGRPAGETDFYRSRKENICVVCGTDKSFIRKNIVPREYRKYFPEILKSHSSHDVVLLCATCHGKSSVFDQQYKEHFAQLCDAPYKSGAVKTDSELKKVKTAARTLNGYSDRIPAEKLAECRKIICQFYGSDEITDDVLETACNLDERNMEHDHGSLVVMHFLEHSTIQEFQRLWRLRFVELMKPGHLGDYWHVDYNHLDYLWQKPEETGNDKMLNGDVSSSEASN